MEPQRRRPLLCAELGRACRGRGSGGSSAGPRRSGGGIQARRRSDARWRLQSRLLLLSLLPLLPPSPPEIPRRACSSVDMRSGRAWLLLPLPRLAARRPTSENGGRSSGRREVVRCARRAPRSRGSGRGSAPSTETAAGAAPRGTLSPAQPWVGVSRFFFFFLIRLGFQS